MLFNQSSFINYINKLCLNIKSSLEVKMEECEKNKAKQEEEEDEEKDYDFYDKVKTMNSQFCTPDWC